MDRLQAHLRGKLPGHVCAPWEFLGSKTCKQKVGETLHEYIRRFSKQCNELPDIMDVDVIRAFISDTTNEALVHELRHCKPRTTRELLDLATSHASSEEAVHAIFCKHKGKTQTEPIDEAKDHNQRIKGKKDS
jgi:hypothetical protein